MKVQVTYDDTLYQLVPKEPTMEMLEVGWMRLVTRNGVSNKLRARYQEMLSAAPTPPAQPAERMPLTNDSASERNKCGSECRRICQHPDGYGGCSK